MIGQLLYSMFGKHCPTRFFFFFGNARCELGTDEALAALDIGRLDLADVSVCARCGGRGVDGVF